MGLFRRFAALAASTLTAVAVIGVAGAATASASTPEPDWMCLVDEATTPPGDYGTLLCAYAQGSNPIAMTVERTTTTNWYFPAGGHGEIYQANTNNCMQVNASGQVIEAQCNGDPDQEWNVDDDTGVTGYWQFQSESELANCLTFNADRADLVVGGCGSTDWYQHFYPIPQSQQ